MGGASSRRTARKNAMFILYRMEMMKEGMESAFRSWVDGHNGREVPDYTRRLVAGVSAHKAEIDKAIDDAAVDWSLDRMPPVDLSIMRIAVFEMRYGMDVPESVAINEAVEMAKAYGTDDSHRFINGILGTLSAG